VIAIDQNSLGIQGFKQKKIDNVEVWYKPLKNGDWALCFFNCGPKPVEINYDWKNEIIKDDVFNYELNFDKQIYTLHDLWAKKDIGKTDKPLRTEIASHDVLMLRLIK
jgi:alpha-galactosidase